MFSGFVIALRGENPHSILQSCIKKYGDKVKFSEIFPTAIKADSTFLANTKIARSGVSMMNHSRITNLFTTVLTQFDTMYAKEAFIMWYLKEGMVKADFENARNNVKKLIDEYKQDEDQPD